MGSDLALRLFDARKQGGAPFPRFSEDDVVNFLVTEAVIARGLQRDEELEKKRQREEWKRRPVGSGTPPRSM